jgi:hypothetical protein
MLEYSGLMSDLLEEWVEHEMGVIKRDLHSHGAHRKMDLVRQFMHAEASDEAKVEYALPAARSSFEHKDRPFSLFDRGLLVAGEALQNLEVQAAFSYARRKLGPGFSRYFVEMPNLWLITDAAVAANASPADLAPNHDVICLCAAECDHVQ